MAQHEFGIISDFEEGRWYSEYTPERYDCIAVHDDVISNLVRDYMGNMMRNRDLLSSLDTTRTWA